MNMLVSNRWWHSKFLIRKHTDFNAHRYTNNQVIVPYINITVIWSREHAVQLQLSRLYTNLNIDNLCKLCTVNSKSLNYIKNVNNNYSKFPTITINQSNYIKKLQNKYIVFLDNKKGPLCYKNLLYIGNVEDAIPPFW